jgi:hypothetical protein
MMMKNITLRAEKTLIQRGRQRAEAENTTLNAEFRRWLSQNVERPRAIADFTAFMVDLNYVRPGKKFSREEMNKR